MIEIPAGTMMHYIGGENLSNSIELPAGWW
jgi:hypothetical protein